MMIYPINKIFNYKFLLKDKNNVIVVNGSPLCTIRNTNTNKYWNGISWQDTEMYLGMNNVGDGIYSYSITFQEYGTYEIVTKEVAYGIEDELTIEVSSGQYAIIGDIFTIRHMILNGDGVQVPGLSATVSIKRMSDNNYFDGSVWLLTPTVLPMQNMAGTGLYLYDFTYDQKESFEINISEASTATNESRLLNFVVSMHESVFVPENNLYTIGSSNIMGTDGGNAAILGSDKKPVRGAKVELHNKENKQVYRTVSDPLGNWSINVEAGNYVIMISHADYDSISLERQVL